MRRISMATRDELVRAVSERYGRASREERGRILDEFAAVTAVPHIAKHGRMAWKNASGYNRRARVEAAMNRWKQVIGGELRAHTDERRATEVAVAVHALNRMLELGRPSYIRVA